MVITREIDDLNKIEYKFTLYTVYGGSVAIYFDSYLELNRATKRHKWQPVQRWFLWDRRSSNMTLPPDVPQDVYNELISSIQFKPKFNVSNF